MFRRGSILLAIVTSLYYSSLHALATDGSIKFSVGFSDGVSRIFTAKASDGPEHVSNLASEFCSKYHPVTECALNVFGKWLSLVTASWTVGSLSHLATIAEHSYVSKAKGSVQMTVDVTIDESTVTFDPAHISWQNLDESDFVKTLSFSAQEFCVGNDVGHIERDVLSICASKILMQIVTRRANSLIQSAQQTGYGWATAVQLYIASVLYLPTNEAIFMRIGWILEQIGDETAAFRWHEAAAAIQIAHLSNWESTTEQKPAKKELRHAIAVSLYKLASIDQRGRRLVSAAKYYVRVVAYLTIDLQSARLSKDNRCPSLLATVCRNIGWLWLTRGRSTDGIRLLERAAALTREFSLEGVQLRSQSNIKTYVNFEGKGFQVWADNREKDPSGALLMKRAIDIQFKISNSSDEEGLLNTIESSQLFASFIALRSATLGHLGMYKELRHYLIGLLGNLYNTRSTLLIVNSPNPSYIDNPNTDELLKAVAGNLSQKEYRVIVFTAIAPDEAGIDDLGVTWLPLAMLGDADSIMAAAYRMGSDANKCSSPDTSEECSNTMTDTEYHYTQNLLNNGGSDILLSWGNSLPISLSMYLDTAKSRHRYLYLPDSHRDSTNFASSAISYLDFLHTHDVSVNLRGIIVESRITEDIINTQKKKGHKLDHSPFDATPVINLFSVESRYKELNTDQKAEIMSGTLAQVFNKHIQEDQKPVKINENKKLQSDILQSTKNYFDSTTQSAGSKRLRVFFIWTTPATTLKLRYRRALESVFFHHPSAEVLLYANHVPDTLFTDFRDQGYDIRVVTYDLAQMLRSSDLYTKEMDSDSIEGKQIVDQWISTVTSHPFRFPNVEADHVRLVAMYLRGGIYMDMDAIVIKSLHTLHNMIGFETPPPNEGYAFCTDATCNVGNAVMAFESANPFIRSCLVSLLTKYSNTSGALNWEYAGDILSTQLFGSSTNQNWFQQGNSHHVTVLPFTYFYRYHVTGFGRFYDRQPDELSAAEDLQRHSIIAHYWNHAHDLALPVFGSLMYGLFNKYKLQSPINSSVDGVNNISILEVVAEPVVLPNFL